MAITAEQRAKRRKYIGSSEVHDIIMGQGYKVWADKTGKLDPPKTMDYMIRGQLLESAIINFAAMTLGNIITEPTELEFFAPDLHLIDHPDGIVDKTGYPLDAKSQGAFAKEKWGDEYTDQVPDRSVIQAQVHMICMKVDFCHVPAYLAFREFQMFGVPSSDKIKQVIADACGHFWDEHVVKDIPPEDESPPLEVLKRIRREPEKVVELSSDDVLNHWLGSVIVRKAVQREEEEYKAVLIAELGTAEAGRAPDGQMVTFFEQRTGGLLMKELKLAHPDIAAEFANPGRHRVLKLKK